MMTTSPSCPPDYDVDLLVIGGGINGAGIARDAAGRGLKVLLCEQDDLAQATSSASSKLIHGGIRYLENYEFRLVREALAERETLLNVAAHIVHPLRFVLPHNKRLRPAWMIRVGLFLYDHLARRSPRLPSAQRLRMRTDAAGKPLKDTITDGFIYSDCRVDDSRLVVLNAVDAQARGAVVLTRHACTALKSSQGRWHAVLSGKDGAHIRVQAQILVNAAGPWVEQVQAMAVGADSPVGHKSRLKLVKGSHITVPRLYDGEHAYILQNDDRRIVFVIPYQGQYSLIGTTDEAFTGDPASVCISAEETQYLCQSVNHYFRKHITPADVRWSYAGVRPLYDDATGNLSAVTRDYVFDITGGRNGQPVLLSIFGGKITTFRRLAEHALEKLSPYIGHRPSWTARAPLPGADMPGADPHAYETALRQRYHWLPASLAQRYVGAYGTLSERFLAGAQSLADLGQDFGCGLYEREARWLVEHEWAHSAEDILWRRTRLGLHANPEMVQQLTQWLETHRPEIHTPREAKNSS